MTTATRNSREVKIWTDGACAFGNGGYGAVLTYGKKERTIMGGERDTTNNRMELMACIVALEALKRPCRVVLRTDSKYVKHGIESWIQKWKRNGWRSMTGPVKNKDLWERLDVARERHQVEWRWVKGHSGNRMNDRADYLARQGRMSIR